MEPSDSAVPAKRMPSPRHVDRMVQSGRVTAKEAELLAAGDPDVIDDVMAGIRVRHASAQLDAAVAAGDLDREEADRVIDRLRTGEHSAELRAWVNRLTRLGREGKGGSVGEPHEGRST